MPYALLDDGLWSHPKVLAAGNEAVGVWARSISYAALHLTDGHVTRALAEMLCGAEAFARVSQRLVEVNLWEVDGANFKIHDFCEWNVSAKGLKHKRKLTRMRVMKHRERNASGNALHHHRKRVTPRVTLGTGTGTGSGSGSDLFSESGSGAKPVPGFDDVWNAYPVHRRVKRAAAKAMWAKLKPSSALVEQMLATLAWQQTLPDWQRDGGQYVPQFPQWLKDARYHDERPPAPTALSQEPERTQRNIGRAQAAIERLRQMEEQKHDA